jgi:hypothetical protein
MKTILLTALVFLSFESNFLYSQTQGWQWAERGGRAYEWDFATSLATDNAGNIFVAGIFNTGSTPLSLGSDTLSGLADYDIFIAKYDGNGNVIWARKAGGDLRDEAFGVSTDSVGNAYVTGTFNGTYFIAGSDTVYNEHTTTDEDMFCLKIDANGNFVWVRGAGAIGSYVRPRSIAADNMGNSYVTGSWNVYGFPFGTDSLTDPANLFLLKYDSNGNEMWAIAPTNGYTWGYSVTTDDSNNVFLTGSYGLAATFFGNDTLNIGTSQGVFVSKISPGGSFTWTKGFPGDTYYARGQAIHINNTGNIFVAGEYASNTVIFGTDTFYCPSNVDNVFFLKMDPNGNVLWAKDGPGNASENGYSIASDSSGNSYLCGYFYSYPYFTMDNDTLWDTLSTPNTGSDIFLIKFDSNGAIDWTNVSLAKNGTPYYKPAISGDGAGNVYLTGFQLGDYIVFGTDTVFNLQYQSGHADFFLAKIGPNVFTSTFMSSENTSSVIYPNPFSAQATLRANDHLRNASLTVYNAQGQMVKRMNGLNGSTITLQRDNLPAGMYFLQIMEETKMIFTNKLIIVD